ncbi:MAG: hypothetical protein ACJATR_001625 [Halopseudomonas sp.]|jgi:hypothetical protein
MGRDCRAGEQNAGAEQAEQKVTKCHCRYFTIHKLDTAIDRSDKHKFLEPFNGQIYGFPHARHH